MKMRRLQELSRGDPDVERELIRKYLADTEQRLSSLESALREMNAELFRLEAHSIKGSSTNMNAEGMRKLACRLEEMAVGSEFASAHNLLESLKEEFRQVSGYLQDYLTSRQSPWPEESDHLG